MPKHANLGIAFIPQKATEEEVDNYAQAMVREFPDCTIMLSALRVNGYNADINKPFLNYVTSSKRKHGLVGRFYPLIAQARVEELDYLFCVLGMKRYPVKIAADFIGESMQRHQLSHLIIGEPVIDLSGSDFETAIDKQAVRRRLLSDSFINYIVSVGLDMSYTNINAGIFGIRTKKDVVQALLGVEYYEDGSLVCPQVAWHLSRSGYAVQKLRVKSVYLNELGFNLEKAVSEVNYVFTMTAASGKHFFVAATADNFLADCVFTRKWATTADRDWFWRDIVEPLKVLRGEK